jgi:predicted DNA-binding transcriptional regulator AlpA
MCEVLVASEVMGRLKVGSSTLGRWCTEARMGTGTFPLPFSEPGKQRRWLASSIDDWLTRQQATSPPPVSSSKQRRCLEEQKAGTQEILAKHYPHRKARREG